MPKTPEWLKNDGKEYTNRPPADAVPSPTGQGGPRVNAEEHNRRLLLRENCSNSSPVQILYGEIAETRKRRGAFFQHASV